MLLEVSPGLQLLPLLQLLSKAVVRAVTTSPRGSCSSCDTFGCRVAPPGMAAGAWWSNRSTLSS
jgi:hypothetical protein